MADVIVEDMAEAYQPPGTMTPVPLPSAEGAPLEQSKHKGRQRLLKGLQRMASSPSLVIMGRSSSAAYSGGGRGSTSCMSLASPVPTFGHSHSSSHSPQLSASSSTGFSTAPTSVPGTPNPEMGCLDFLSRARMIDNEKATTSRSPPRA